MESKCFNLGKFALQIWTKVLFFLFAKARSKDLIIIGVRCRLT